MAEILPTASYVRRARATQDAERQRAILTGLGEQADLDPDETSQLWDLLETPQTVDTLCRSIGAEESPDSERITQLLADLYEKDLIQLSPDS
jgi:hypothetical protein